MSRISNLKEDTGKLTFTISNIDVSYVNAVRRTLLADIPSVVFKTTPNEENRAVIFINTTRFNNEIIKQRLSCIPICIQDVNELPINQLVLELDIENKTDTMLYVTTHDFKLRDVKTGKFVDENTMKRIFPPFVPSDGNGEYYIDFLRLRPKISEEIPGERIKLSCELSVSTARDDSMFNVTGTCSYRFTPDIKKMEEQVAIRKQKWKDEGKNDKEIAFEAENWKLLEGLRYVVKNSFDFVLETVGIYENEQLMIKACDVLLDKFDKLKHAVEHDELDVKPSDNTLENCYDITLVNEDYTIGNILNQEITKLFYNELNIVNYVGFKKMHPHDSNSVLRISITDPTKGIATIKTILFETISRANKELLAFKSHF